MPWRRPPRGFALALVLLVLAISVILGLSFLNSSRTATRLATGADAHLKARMIAESGLGIAMRYLSEDPEWRINRPNGAWIVDQPFAGGSFTVYGEDGSRIDPQGAVVGDGDLADNLLAPVTLSAIGTWGEVRYRVSATVWPPVSAGIAVSERITIRGDGLIDSYCAVTGPYDETNRGEDAIISSNAVGNPHVTLRDSARINGNVYVGPGGSPGWAVRILDSAVVNGQLATLPQRVVLPSIEVPQLPPSVGNRVYSSGMNIISSDMRCDNLTITDNGVVFIQGDVHILVEGDLWLGGGGVLQIGVPRAYGAAVSGTAEVLEDAVVDSFNSRIGPYGEGGNAGSGAAIATNAAARASILLSSATLRGDAYSGADSNPTNAIRTEAGGTITGRRTALDEPLIIPAPAAWPTGVGGNIGVYERSSGVHTINSNMQMDSFRIGGTATVRISGNRTFRVNGELIVEDSARLELLPGSSLRVHVGEAVTISGSARVNNNTQNPSLMLFYGRGVGYEHTIVNDARVHAVIDSPGSALTISDDARFFGAFLGQTLQVKVRGRFHNDLNPNIIAANSRLPVVPKDGDRLTLHTRGGVTITEKKQINRNTGEAERLILNHLSDQPVLISGTSRAYATIIAPDALCRIEEDVRYTGRIMARDLQVRGATTISAVAGGGTAQPGLLARETIEVGGSAVISGVDGNAVLASNAISTIAISVEDSAALEGSAFAGPGGDAAVDIFVEPAARITGQRDSLSEAVEITGPAGEQLAPPQPDRIYTGFSMTTLSRDLHGNDLQVIDDAVVEIEGHVTITLTGELTLAGRGQIRLLPDATLTIYCARGVRILDDARLNPDGDPSRVLLSCDGERIELRDRARAYAAIVAPAAMTSIRDRAELFGSYLGRQLKVESEAQVHQNIAGKRLRWIE